MGLADDLMKGVRASTPELKAFHRNIAEQMEAEQTQWIADLRAAGVKAAHPDDGWVDRQENYVRLVYPQFDDGIVVGDIIALGWPQRHRTTPQHRLVKVVRIEPTPNWWSSCTSIFYFVPHVT
jgi:hypothetical protein